MTRIRMAMVAVVVCAVASLGLMVWTGRRQGSFILMALFTGWVLAPFVALLLAGLRCAGWSLRMRSTLLWTMLCLALGSVAAYGGVIPMPAGSKPAFVFLVAPLVSWLLIVPVVRAGAVSQRREHLT